jgi:type IV secretory pathway TraG/TraD family ATPase VirD4
MTDYIEGQEEKGRRALATAKFTSHDILDRQGYESGDFWLGRTTKGRPFGWYDDLNLLTCAGPRSGKGVSTVIPNLMLYPGSAVVIDPKGELAELTAAYRKDVLGQKVVVLDPARVAEIPDDLRGTYNPLSELDPDDERNVVSMAQAIASGIVVPKEDAKDPFWDDTAVNYIQSVILYMLKRFEREEDRTLMKLRQLVSMGDVEGLEEFVSLVREDEPDFQPKAGKATDIMLEDMLSMKNFGGIVAEAASKVRTLGDSTSGNVLGGAMTNLDFLNEPRLWDCLYSTVETEKTFCLDDLRSQDQHLTVYLCLPVDMMEKQGRWLRLICNHIIQYLQRTKFDKNTQYPVLMMIDEFYQLGTMKSITNTLTYTPGAGLRVWLIIQNLGQLKERYPRSWETIMSACGVKQFFGVNDYETAEYISKYIGEEEVIVPTVTVTESETGTEGQTLTEAQSKSRTITDTQGTSSTSTVGTSSTIGTSQTQTVTDSSSVGISSGISDTTGHSSNYGYSQNSGWNVGQNTGVNAGQSGTYSPVSGNATSTSQSSGSNSGNSTGRSGGTGTNSGYGQSSSRTSNAGRSRQSSHSVANASGYSESQTSTYSTASGISNSTAIAHGDTHTRSEALSKSLAKGKSYARGFTRQTRKLFRPEEVLTAFTRDNLTQLVLIRDQQAQLLQRTPYYMDNDFIKLIEDYEQDTKKTNS